MSNVFSNARVVALLGLLAYAPLAATQTLEIVVGQARYRDAPGTSVPVDPYNAAFGVDGRLYVLDLNGHLMRFDPSTGTATALPANDDETNFEFGYTAGMAFDATGTLHLVGGSTFMRVDPNSGVLTTQGFAPNYHFAFGPDGLPYFIIAGHIEKRLWNGDLVRVAGANTQGFGGDGGPAMAASFSDLQAIAFGPGGDMYVADAGNNRIRKISAANGLVTTVAGAGFSGSDGIPATQAHLTYPRSLVFDVAGNLYVGGLSDNRIRRIDAVTGLISTVTTATSAPGTLALDGAGSLYFSTQQPSGGRVIRRVNLATGVATLVLGNADGYFCGENVVASAACFSRPFALDVNVNQDLLITDTTVNRLRKLSSATNQVSTVLTQPTWAFLGVDHDATGNVYVATFSGNYVKKIDAVTGLVSIVAGNGNYGFGGDGGLATSATLASPVDVAVDAAGNTYISDTNNNRVRKVDAASGLISTFAGGGGSLGDGGPASNSSLNGPQSLRFDAAGNLYIADGENCRLRKVNAATGIISTIAGTGVCQSSNTTVAGIATAMKIGRSAAFALDANGIIYLSWSEHIYRVDTTTNMMTRVAAPSGGFATAGGVALGAPRRMEFDAAGRLYLTVNNLPYVFRISGLTDSTPPVIAPQISGTAGPGGWYRSDVQVAWNVSDGESPVLSTNGCVSSSVSADTDGVTFTCTATSQGGTASGSVTVRRDTIAPTLSFGAVEPAPDADGWNTLASIPFTAGDALSGVYSTSSPNPIDFSDEGAGQSRAVTVTDNAGNTATFTSPAVNVDHSAPSLAYGVTGLTGNNGWYRGDVAVHWDITEATSPIRSSEGCADSTITNDTAGITFTCTAVSAGGTQSASLTIKRDATAPQFTFAAPSPAPNGAGWNNSDVAFAFDTTDALSGVASTSVDSPAVITGNGAGLSIDVLVTDVAGNAATFSTPVVNIDRSPPTVQPVITGTLGNNGWYTSDVAVSWAIDETPASILSSTGCGASSVTTNTAGTTFTCSVTSSGGTASSSITLKRDATPPVLSFGSFSPAPNVNGWNKTNVSVPFTRSDALSGLATTSTTSPLLLSTEGAGVTGEVVVTDLAGNAATFTTAPRNIDKTPPVITLTTPAQDQMFGFYEEVPAQFSCTDVSLVSCVGPVASGALVNTKSGGDRTFKVTAKDQVLFTSTLTNNYFVAWEFNFNEFLAPINGPPVLNLVTRGSLVPIRWQLPDGNGGFVSNTAAFVSVTVGTLSCGSAPVVPLSDTANGPAGVNYDAATGSFTYNWQTNAGWTGCRKLTIKLKDNSTHELRFKFQ